MKKNKITIASVGIGVYALTLGTMVVLDNWIEKTSKHNELFKMSVSKQIEINKAKNTAESMIGWVMEDVTNGDGNQENAEMYIENLEELIETIRIIENEGL